LIFIFCYWRILIVIRRQARVVAGHNDNTAGPSAAAQPHAINTQIQASVIKTMIFVSAFYAISWLPSYIIVLSMNLNPNPSLPDGTYYVSLGMVFLYTSANPFIYATNFDPVKKVLQRMILCKKTE